MCTVQNLLLDDQEGQLLLFTISKKAFNVAGGKSTREEGSLRFEYYICLKLDSAHAISVYFLLGMKMELSCRCHLHSSLQYTLFNKDPIHLRRGSNSMYMPYIQQVVCSGFLTFDSRISLV